MHDAIASLANVSLRQLRAFVTVAEVGSFTAAASALNLTQSAVRVLIAELERGLGLRLFDRTTRSVRLTDAGQELHLPARRVLVDLQAAVSSSRELAAKKRGRVRIAATPLFSSLFLPAIILEFQAAYPDVEVIVRDTAVPLVHRMPDEGEVDLGIGSAPTVEPPLVWDILVMDEVVLVCAPDCPLAKRSHVEWSDLLDYPYIAVSPESSTREIVDATTAVAGVQLVPSFEVSSVWTLLGMVSAGLGIALATGNVRLLLSLYPVKILRVGRERIDRPIGLMRHQNRSLSPAAAAFRDCVRTWTGTHADIGVR
jgi:DNA-binding transcriptional LysR family regulator